jgi:hypothetical protein
MPITRSSVDAHLLRVVQATRYLSDGEVLGFTAWGEADNQPVEGQIAVMMTVRNRTRRSGRSLRQECLRPWQYSCWVPDPQTTNDERMLDTLAGYTAKPQRETPILLRQCIALAGLVANGTLLDNTFGSTHYCTRTLWNVKPPSWAKGRIPACTYRDHVFFSEID